MLDLSNLITRGRPTYILHVCGTLGTLNSIQRYQIWGAYFQKHFSRKMIGAKSFCQLDILSTT